MTLTSSYPCIPRRTPAFRPELPARWRLGLAALALLWLAVAPLAASAQGSVTLEAHPLGSHLEPMAGATSVANLDCDTPAPAGANTCLQVRVSCNPCNVTIPDLQTVSVDANLTAANLQNVLGTSNCTIRDANAAVEIDHSFVGDLGVDFERPGGAAEATLYFPPDNCNATRVDAIFNDEATLPADACPASGGQSYRSRDPLSDFDGLPAVGGYQFQVADLQSGDTGLLQRWGYALALDCVTTPPPTGCVPNATTLCLNNGRFQVTVDWATPQGTSGQGRAVKLTNDTGYFWFFNQDNVEMVVKVLNACSFANRFWVFAGGLTNVEVEMRVVDTQRGGTQRYMNPLRTPFQPIQDTQAFATCP